MQVIDSPICSKSILDSHAKLTESLKCTMDIDIDDSLGSSDHRLISFTLITKVTCPLQPSEVVFKYKNVNWTGFAQSKLAALEFSFC